MEKKEQTTDRNNKTKSKTVDLISGLLMTALNVNTLQITNKRQRLSHWQENNLNVCELIMDKQNVFYPYNTI